MEIELKIDKTVPLCWRLEYRILGIIIIFLSPRSNLQVGCRGVRGAVRAFPGGSGEGTPAAHISCSSRGSSEIRIRWSGRAARGRAGPKSLRSLVILGLMFIPRLSILPPRLAFKFQLLRLCVPAPVSQAGCGAYSGYMMIFIALVGYPWQWWTSIHGRRRTRMDDESRSRYHDAHVRATPRPCYHRDDDLRLLGTSQSR